MNDSLDNPRSREEKKSAFPAFGVFEWVPSCWTSGSLFPCPGSFCGPADMGGSEAALLPYLLRRLRLVGLHAHRLGWSFGASEFLVEMGGV